MKHPLLRVAAWYAAGLWIGLYWPIPIGWLLGWGWVMCGVYWVCPGLRRWGLGPVLVVMGMARYGLETAAISPHDLRWLSGWNGAAVTVRGAIAIPPEERVSVWRGKETERTWTVLAVEELRRDGGPWQRGVGRVAVQTRGFLGEHFGIGDHVEVDGMWLLPEGCLVEGMFDLKRHLARQGIHFQLQVGSPGHWRWAPGQAGQGPRLTERFARWAKATLGRGHPVEDVYLQLVWAMALGLRTGMNGEVAEMFMESGTMHIFAISGLHVALIMGCLAALLRVVGMPRAWIGLVTLPLIWFYTGATGWQASAVRSAVMSSVVLAGWILNRPGDLMNSLGAAALILLVWDPKQLFQPGFQLSFFVVFSMILAGPLLEGLRQRVVVGSEWQAEGWRGWCHRKWEDGLRRVTMSLTTSLAAWAGSLPLVAYYFHYFNPVAILANLVVVPLSGLVLASCLGSLMAGAWWGWGCELFNHSAWLWMVAMVKASKFAASLPWGWAYVESPSIWGMGIYYGVLTGIASGWWRHGVGRWGLLLAGLVLSGLILQPWVRGWTQHELLVVPMEGGDATLFRGPASGSPLMIDGGSQELAARRTIPLLKARGVNRLSGLVLTHGDVRHVGGAVRITEGFHANAVYGSDVSFRSAAYRDVKRRMTELGRWHSVKAGDAIGAWQVLYPAAGDRFSKADDGPVVLWGTFHGCRVLLLSDLSVAGQNHLLNRHPELRADVVVTGLPAPPEPVVAGFLEVVQPRWVILVDAMYPAYARASPALRRRLEASGFQVWSTGADGPVRVVIRKSGWRIERE